MSSGASASEVKASRSGELKFDGRAYLQRINFAKFAPKSSNSDSDADGAPFKFSPDFPNLCAIIKYFSAVLCHAHASCLMLHAPCPYKQGASFFRSL
jgi:hypothetical protein